MSDDPFDMLRPMPPKVAPERAVPEESEASLDAFLQLGTPPAAAPAPSCTPDGVAMPKAGISVDALSEEAVVEKINAAVERSMKKYAGDLMAALEGVTTKLAKMQAALEKNETSVAAVAGDLKQMLEALSSAQAAPAAPAVPAPAPTPPPVAAAAPPVLTPPVFTPQQQQAAVAAPWPASAPPGESASPVPAPQPAVGMPVAQWAAPVPTSASAPAPAAYGTPQAYGSPPPAQTPPQAPPQMFQQIPQVPQMPHMPQMSAQQHMPQGMPPLPMPIPGPDGGAHYGGAPPPPPPPQSMGPMGGPGPGLGGQMTGGQMMGGQSMGGQMMGGQNMGGQMGPSGGGYHHQQHQQPPHGPGGAPGYSGPHHTPGPPGLPRGNAPAAPASIQSQSVTVSMDKVVEDFASMGFTRDQVRGVIRQLTESGQGVDLNVVLDRLMNGGGGRPR